MALLSNQGEPVSKWWLSKSISIINSQPDFFSGKNLRVARRQLIAGTNRLQTIEGWLLAAGLVDRDQKKRSTEYFLTHFGHYLHKNDPDLQRSNSWWAIHLYLCFSKRSDPYSQIMKLLGSNHKSWIGWNDLLLKLKELENFQENKSSSIESIAGGIRRMFVGDRPLAELGLVTVRKESFPQGHWLQLGSPRVSDSIIVHALALARESYFPTRTSVDYSEILKIDLHSFLCLSSDELRAHIRRLSHNGKWNSYFNYTEAVNLNSIGIFQDLTVNKTLLHVLHETTNSWL